VVENTVKIAVDGCASCRGRDAKKAEAAVQVEKFAVGSLFGQRKVEDGLL
jgi:hypothetical protein